MRCQNSKSGQYRLTSGSKVIEQDALSHTRNSLCWPVDIHSVTRSSHHPARRLAKQRARGRNLQSEQKWRWLADVNFYRKFIWVLNKTLICQGSLLQGSKLEGRLHYKTSRLGARDYLFFLLRILKIDNFTQAYTPNAWKEFITIFFLTPLFLQLLHLAFLNS